MTRDNTRQMIRIGDLMDIQIIEIVTLIGPRPFYFNDDLWSQSNNQVCSG